MEQAEVKSIRVLLVDDHFVVRAGLRAILAEHSGIEVVGEAETATVAVNEVRRLLPEVVLLDLRLPGPSGAAACREIKSMADPPRVLILTSFTDEGSIAEAMDAGADGYLLKDSRDDVLAAAIRTVAAGGSILAPAVARMLRERQAFGKFSAGALSRLSNQEIRVLGLVAEGRTNKEIAMALGTSDKTVRNQVSSLMGKLEVERRTQAAAVYLRQNRAQ